MKHLPILKLVGYTVGAIFLKFFLVLFLDDKYSHVLQFCVAMIILLFGAFYILRGVANLIEETTDVLGKRTKLAGGLLQSFGTAFPDMVLGVMAAITSLKLRGVNEALSINYALIAAATTFGSNIYNIGHAAWCIWRQNLANSLNKKITMIPLTSKGGELLPIRMHIVKPALKEIDTSIAMLTALSVLTAFVALSMVFFGNTGNYENIISGDLYQLIKPVGFIVLIVGVFIIYAFRKSHRPECDYNVTEEDEKYFGKQKSLFIWIVLFIAGIVILLAAESMVHAIEVIAEVTHIPFVIAGALSGIIGCLGEMIVVHNYSVNPKGRLGDALVGVAMDNNITIIGASLVAMMGGIFLGGSALISIFVIIFALNTVLLWQMAILKNYL